MGLVASGDLRIDVRRVPLAQVQEVWNLDQKGARTVLIP
jgi:NADPH2:quinone reductase